MNIHEYQAKAVLREFGVPVPRVAAAAEYIGPGVRLQSVLAVEELTGRLALHEAVPLALRRLSPAEFTALVTKQIADFQPAVKASGAKLN